jgi:hypothetical protein
VIILSELVAELSLIVYFTYLGIFLIEADNFSFTISSKMALGITKPPMRTENSFFEDRTTDLEADQSPFSAEVKNKWT